MLPGRGENGLAPCYSMAAIPLGPSHPTARSLGRALLAAGFAVLALDHPSRGPAPPPSVDAGLRPWDPLSCHVAAMEWLESCDEVTEMLGTAGPL